MNAPVRHLDTGKGLWSYGERVEVLCPRCGRPGTVRAQWQPYRWTARYVCEGCHLQASTEDDSWRGVTVYSGRRPCGYCGHRWLWARRVFDARPAHAPATLDVSCPVCAHASAVAVKASRCNAPRDGRDPHFGLPLRLVEATRAGVIWAYNAEHLDELRRYVAADHREANVLVNRSMASRLPTWMKLARHRARVLRGLDQLAAKLATSPRP